MIDGESEAQILEQFRKWLHEMRQAAATLDEEEDAAALPAPGFGLERLVEEFTALRHELKLQTRSARTLEERLEAALTPLAEAATALRSVTTSPASTADKTFATALAELDEALERGRVQWEKGRARLIDASGPALRAQLQEVYAGLSWWQRRFSAGYHRRVCQQVEQADEQARRYRESLLEALLNGYALIQQRLAQTMSQAGVMRIPTAGRLVDPDLMIVVEVVDDAGPAGQVVEEVRRGYLWNGKVLRPAEVRASRPRFEQASQV